MSTDFANVVVLDAGTFPPETRIRALRFPHRIMQFQRTAPSELAHRIQDAHIVITNKVPLTASDLAAAKSLKLIAVAATGYNSIDIESCEQRQIAVCNIRNYAMSTVPEHTFMLILALRRSLKAYDRSVLRGRWAESKQFCYFDHDVQDLAGSTLGIIGGGSLGTRVGQLGKAFGMKVLFSARKGSPPSSSRHTPFEQVVSESDVVSLHCPLTEMTQNLIGKPEFDAMRRTALLVNTARGGLVNESDLVEAIELGKIAGAGFDVTTLEPPDGSHPLVRLAERDNFILTPHIGWTSRQAVQGLADQLIENIESFWAGRPRNLVTASAP